VSLITAEKLRIPVLFAGVVLGIYVGRFVAPTWMYVDNFEIWETGEELLQYRMLHTAIVFGVTVSVFALIAARLVGLGIISVITVSSISIVILSVFDQTRTGSLIDTSMILVTLKGLPFFFFSLFSVYGIWCFLQLFRNTDKFQKDT